MRFFLSAIPSSRFRLIWYVSLDLAEDSRTGEKKRIEREHDQGQPVRLASRKLNTRFPGQGFVLIILRFRTR
jgi:hypothetical protein